MALILENKKVADSIYLMKVKPEAGMQAPKPGQFYMVRGWGNYPFLSRPLSVFDYEELDIPGVEGERTLSFLYEDAGQGTHLLSRMKAGEDLTVDGPLGEGFPEVDQDLVLIGGGIGIAPLYYLARSYRKNHRDRKLTVYLGFTKEDYMTAEFEEVASQMDFQVGGYVTDLFKGRVFTEEETVCCCGPEAMMEAVMGLVGPKTPVFVSLEARMACGVGACLGCVTEAPLLYRVQDGSAVRAGVKHVKVCEEGPVFEREVLK